MRILALIALLASTTAAGASPEPGPDNFTLACAGPFAKNATAATVAKVFGKENVKTQMVPGAEGEDTKATVIYPSDRSKRVEIFWWDERKLARPDSIRIRGDKSVWKLGSLTAGATLAEVQKANGKPFTISGLAWDYGGFVTDWQGGELETKTVGCHVLVRFSTPEDVEIPEGLMGDGVSIASTDEAFVKLAPRIGWLSIGYPDE